MDPQLRAKFNADFTPDKYAALLRCVNETEKWPADFRVSETPIFLSSEFADEVVRAANAIVELTRTPEFAQHARSAIPKGLEMPNESAHPNFFVIDFAICRENGQFVPRLIELSNTGLMTNGDAFTVTEPLVASLVNELFEKNRALY